MTVADFDEAAKRLSLSAKEIEAACSAIKNHPLGALIEIDGTGIYPPFATEDPERAREELELELMRQRSAAAGGWEFAGPYGTIGEPRFIASPRTDRITHTPLFWEDITSRSKLALIRKKQPDGSYLYGYANYGGKVVVPVDIPEATHFGEFPIAMTKNQNGDTLVFAADGLLFQMFSINQKVEVRGPYRRRGGGTILEVLSPAEGGAHVYQWVLTPKAAYFKDAGIDSTEGPAVAPSASAADAGQPSKITATEAMEKAAAAAAGKTSIREFNLEYLKNLKALMDQGGIVPGKECEEREGEVRQRMRENPYKE